MSTRIHRALSAADRAALWQRWKEGESATQIARELGRGRGYVRGVLQHSGGIAPAPRKRADHTLSLAQREEISRGICASMSAGQIARVIGKSTSTVSREIHRNGGRHRYRAVEADRAAWRRAQRPKHCVLARHPQLCRRVAEGLKQQWSPQQIARRLVADFPNDHSMRVSHETIYRSLFIQARGALKKELLAHLRTHRKMRHSRKANHRGDGRGKIVEALSIRERPAEADDRAVPGHWEGDLISGKNNSHLATLVERGSRYVMLVKVPSKETAPVIKALSRKIKTLPRALRRSLTWDGGKEMANHKQFTLATDLKVYICDPHSPWQRGSNENTNGLLRQYFPKGTDLSVHSQANLDFVARRLNGRPRETLEFKTPAEVFSQFVASTG